MIMIKMATKTIIALSILLSFFSFSQEKNAEKNKETDSYSLTAEEQEMLEKSTLSYKANELQDLYSQTVINNNVKFDRRYLLDNPLSLSETLDFSHPYLNTLVSELTEGDRDAILESVREDQMKYQRHKSILLTAMKFATDSAFYKKTRDFHDKLLNEYYHNLTKIFPFHILALEGGKIRPPVIEEIGFTREIESQRVRREIKKRYRISKQAEVMNEAQTFMDFFGNLVTEKPKAPNVYMLPLNNEELAYWKKGILNGWVEGDRLANQIIRANIRTTIQEFNGQLRFHYLARAQIVSRPTSQNINIGTNANGFAVNIGESIFEITDLPRFNDKEMTWIALPQVDDIFDKLTQSDLDELSEYLAHPGDLR
jgi:hypothetical protein